MSPQERALKLCQDIAMTTFGEDFNQGTTLPLAITKKIAVICVDEIIKEIQELHKPEYVIFIINDKQAPNMDNMNGYEKIDYWQSVKEAILVL